MCIAFFSLLLVLRTYFYILSNCHQKNQHRNVKLFETYFYLPVVLHRLLTLVVHRLRPARLGAKDQNQLFFSENMQNGALHQHCVGGKGVMVCFTKASESYSIILLISLVIF